MPARSNRTKSEEDILAARQRRKDAELLRKLQHEERTRRLKRWYIKLQWQSGICRGDPMDWRSWRTFAVVPILFRSEQAAWDYIDNHMFKNLKHRKMSCSVETRWLKDAQ